MNKLVSVVLGLGLFAAAAGGQEGVKESSVVIDRPDSEYTIWSETIDPKRLRKLFG